MPREIDLTSLSSESKARRAYPNVVKFITGHPWAIQQEKLEAIADVIERRVGFEGFGRLRAMEDDDVVVAPRAAAGPPYQRFASAALIPVMGTIAKRMNYFSDMSGGASIEMIGNAFRTALADPDVHTIVLQIDSPGGSVYGVQELADEIYAARGVKKIVAIADDLAASAAFWIGCAASEFVVTPSGEVGSVGVVAMHVDYSKALEQDGVKVTYVHAGDNKVEGNPYEPLADDARAFMQKRVDDYYKAFTNAVARGRNISVADVKKHYGQGRVYGAIDAKAAGMVDRIATLNETMQRIASKPTARRTSRAQACEADIQEAIRNAS